MQPLLVRTIGFTGTDAQHFFERLKSAGVRKVIDVRLHNTSQLAGFAKSGDLKYFLKEIDGIEYRHEPLLAPTDDMLKEYKKARGSWSAYELRFLDLLGQREVQNKLERADLEGACLLCSEAEPHHCHRRLVCEYLSAHWPGGVSAHHL